MAAIVPLRKSIEAEAVAATLTAPVREREEDVDVRSWK
jgi:hypothetical protein